MHYSPPRFVFRLLPLQEGQATANYRLRVLPRCHDWHVRSAVPEVRRTLTPPVSQDDAESGQSRHGEAHHRLGLSRWIRILSVSVVGRWRGRSKWR